MQTFSIKTVNGDIYLIDGSSVKDIFSRIDGLRLMGKRWLETYLFNGDGEMFSVYVSIDQIVSIQ